MNTEVEENAFAAALLHAVGDEDALRAALRDVQSRLRASNASLSIVNKQRPGEGLYVATEIDQQLVDAYFPQMAEDPWYSRLSARVGEVHVLGTDLVPQRVMRRSRIYADFNRRVGLERLATSALLGGDTDVLLIANGSRRRGNFDREALRALGRLLPHATRFARLQQHAGTSAAAAREDCLDVDARGVCYVGPAAARALAASGVARVHLRRLRLPAPGADAFARDVGLCLRGLTPVGVLRIRALGGTLELDIAPARTAGDGASRWLARVRVRLEVAEAASLATAIGLTPAERRVLAALQLGQSARDLAERSHRSVNTVRSQIKSLLRKTGARRQVELLRMFPPR